MCYATGTVPCCRECDDAGECLLTRGDEMIDGMDFSDALQALKKGRRVQRLGWNGSGMYLCLVDGSQFTVNRAPLNKHLEEGVVVNYHAHIDIYTAQGYLVPWVASQTDLLADDWQTLNDGEGHG